MPILLPKKAPSPIPFICSTAGGKVFPYLTVSHKFPRETSCPRQFCGNHPFLKNSVITPRKQPCPMVITEIFRNGPYYHGTQCVPLEFVWHRETQETLPPAVRMLSSRGLCPSGTCPSLEMVYCAMPPKLIPMVWPQCYKMVLWGWPYPFGAQVLSYATKKLIPGALPGFSWTRILSGAAFCNALHEINEENLRNTFWKGVKISHTNTKHI